MKRETKPLWVEQLDEIREILRESAIRQMKNDEQIAANAEQIAANAEQIAANAEQIAANTEQIAAVSAIADKAAKAVEENATLFYRQMGEDGKRRTQLSEVIHLQREQIQMQKNQISVLERIVGHLFPDDNEDD